MRAAYTLLLYRHINLLKRDCLMPSGHTVSREQSVAEFCSFPNFLLVLMGDFLLYTQLAPQSDNVVKGEPLNKIYTVHFY